MKQLQYLHTDSGNCRVYYKTPSGALVCFQLESFRTGNFDFLICSRDGEPSHGIKSEQFARPNLPPAEEVAEDSMLRQFAAFLDSGRMQFATA